MVYSLWVVICVCGFAQAAAVPCADSTNPIARGIVSKVDKAVIQIERGGVNALERAFKGGEPWDGGDEYVFVFRDDGQLVSCPAYPQLVGKNMFDFRDVAGKRLVRLMLDKVRSHDRAGWVHYLWTPPGVMNQEWKSSFVREAMAPDGSRFVVGAGSADLPMLPCFAEEMVDDAVALLEQDGESAFNLIRSRTGPFVWGTSYVFVLGINGIGYVNPGHPHLEGMNIRHLTGADDSPFVERMISVQYGEQGEWISYGWPKPGEAMPCRKVSFVRKARVNGQEYIVGCGLYLE